MTLTRTQSVLPLVDKLDSYVDVHEIQSGQSTPPLYSGPSETSLISPEMFQNMIPMLPASHLTTLKCRAEIEAVLDGRSDKMVVVVGPCSIHDPLTALEYARLLAQLNQDPVISSNLILVMRAYLEKPRTTVGWKGILNDPDLDGSFNIAKGMFISRQLLSDITALGVPVATELLGILTPRYLAEFFALGAIGARTTESQVHRELVSSLSFPVGFKNGTDGGVTVALDAIESAASPHSFAGISRRGEVTIIGTDGNKSTFLILRGGGGKTNFDAESVQKAKTGLKARGQRENLMIDCSHGNSNKNHNNQPLVVSSIAGQLKEGERSIIGVMLESHLEAGNQSLPKLGRHGLKRGVSITDACIDWLTTTKSLYELADAVCYRRNLSL